MMRGRCKVIIVIIWAIVEKIEREKKGIFFHGNVTELFVSKNACKVCASSREALQKLFSVIDYTNTSRNNKKMLGYQLYIFIHWLNKKVQNKYEIFARAEAHKNFDNYKI